MPRDMSRHATRGHCPPQMFLLCSFLGLPSFHRQDMAGIKRALDRDLERDRRATTLADLAALGHDVFCWCNRCGHNAVLPTPLLAERLGAAMPVPDVGAHLRCTGCGTRDIATRPAWPSPGLVSRHG